LVAGANGQLGSAIAETFSDLDVVACGRDRLDVTDERSVRRVLADQRPDVVINCAAYNDVDGAEDEAAHALSVNALGVRSLARQSAEVRATFVHYSTDFVFDGAAALEYTEDAAPSPQSVYGASKLMGEWLARDASSYLIIRVESLFGGTRATSSIDRIVDGLIAGSEVKAFVDRTISPSYVYDVATATRAALDAQAPSGLYHCVNDGQTTWYELALEAARLLGSTSSVVPTAVDEVTFRAARPKFSPLATGSLARLGISLPSWQDALRRYVESRRSV
jgi:dTDP-4-dehydrorhamnose reductase